MIHITGVDYEGLRGYRVERFVIRGAFKDSLVYHVMRGKEVCFGTTEECDAHAFLAIISNAKTSVKQRERSIITIRDEETDGMVQLLVSRKVAATIDYTQDYKDTLKRIARRLGVRIDYSDEVSYSKDQRKFYTKTGRLRMFDMPNGDFILDDLAIERVNELTRRESLIEELSQDLGQCPAYAEQRIRAIALQLLEMAPNANRLEPGARILEL